MSDSRRRSRRSSTSTTTSGSHRTTSSRHHSSRHLSATSSSSANRSSSSVNRASSSSVGGSSGSASGSANANSNASTSGSGSGRYGGSDDYLAVSGAGSSSRSGVGQIYGSMAARASESRFSLTDQFAATRSVYDFDFDDGASSVFDTASVFSMGTSRAPSIRAPSTRAPSIAPSSVWSSGFGDDSYLSSDGGDTIMAGYSTVLEEDEDDDDDDDDDDEDGQHTPKQHAQKGEGGIGGSKHTAEQLQNELLQLQQDQLLLRSPLLQATPPGQPQPMQRTYYEVLCLARQPAPRSGEIRAAYYRLFRLLNNNRSGGGRGGIAKALQPTAAFYFAQAQAAFETLIDPARRLEYDRYLDDQEEEEEDGNDGEEGDTSSSDTDGEEDVDEEKKEAQGEDEVRRLRALASRQSFQATTDMGIRYDASRVLLPRRLQLEENLASSSSLRSVDYSLTQAVRVGLPGLGRCTEAGILQLQRRLRGTAQALNRLRGRFGRSGACSDKTIVSTQRLQPWPVFCSTPIVGVSASMYAVTSTSADWRSSRDAPLSADRHQPLLAEVLVPTRAVQLADTRSTGRVVLSYRQEFAWGPMPSRLPPTVAEVEAEVLPRPSVTTRVAHPIPLTIPRIDEAIGVLPEEPLYVEIMVHDGKASSLAAPAPRLGLGLSRRMGGGSVFLCADSGSGSGSGSGWSLWWPMWLSPSSASDAVKAVSAVAAPCIAPMVEVGYCLSAQELGLHAMRPLTGPADRGLKGIDGDLDAVAGCSSRSRGMGTWTVSAAVAGRMTLAGYLRYGRTLFLTPWRHLGKKAPKGRRTNGSRRAVRVEAELCASRFSSDGYLAIRGLAPIQWWGLRNSWTAGPSASSTPPKLGLEVALSAGSGSVHVSLYWSRVGQRIKLPFLLLPASADLGVTSRLFFWAAGLPVAIMAVRELVQVYLRARRRQERKQMQKQQQKQQRQQQRHQSAANDAADTGFEDFEEEQVISRHRAEADELTMVLSSAVDAQREAAAAGSSSSSGSSSGSNSNSNSNSRYKDVGGLVILSAKYGVALADDWDDLDGAVPRKRASISSGTGASASMATRNGWSPDYEVADVTAAVAAMVVPAGSNSNVPGLVSAHHGTAEANADSDYLLIPRGVRKSRLLGFWDPAPHFRRKQQHQQQTAHAKKVLHVRYLWRGQERIAEVGERDDLRLP